MAHPTGVHRTAMITALSLVYAATFSDVEAAAVQSGVALPIRGTVLGYTDAADARVRPYQERAMLQASAVGRTSLGLRTAGAAVAIPSAIGAAATLVALPVRAFSGDGPIDGAEAGLYAAPWFGCAVAIGLQTGALAVRGKALRPARRPR